MYFSDDVSDFDEVCSFNVWYVFKCNF